MIVRMNIVAVFLAVAFTGCSKKPADVSEDEAGAESQEPMIISGSQPQQTGGGGGGAGTLAPVPGVTPLPPQPGNDAAGGDDGTTGAGTDDGGGDGTPVQNPPEWSSLIGDFSADEDAEFSRTAVAADPDGDAVTYSLDPDNMTCDDGAFSQPVAIDPVTGVVTGIPTNADVGVCTIKIVAESEGGSVEETLTVTVLNTNDLPYWTLSAADQSVLEFDALSATVAAADDDAGAVITYSLDTASMSCDDGAFSPQIAIDPLTGAISGTPGYADVGASCSVTVVATSGADTISQTFNVSVEERHPFFSGSGTETTLSADLNIATAASLKWSTGSFTSGWFEHASGAGDEVIKIKQAGNYFVSFQMPVIVGTGCTGRCAVRTQLLVNGTPVPEAYSASSYLRNSSGHMESSNSFNAFLQNLRVDDTVELRISRVTSGSGTVSTPGAALYIEYVRPARTVFSANATATTNGPMINDVTPYPLVWVDGLVNTGIGHDDSINPEQIVLGQPGDYLVHVNVPAQRTGACNGSNDRKSVKVSLMLDGTPVAGGTAAQGYIRCSSGHQESSMHFSGLVRSAGAGSVLTVETVAAAVADHVYVTSGQKASVVIEKVDTSERVLSVRSTRTVASTNLNLAASLLLWSTQDILDGTMFSHSDTVNAEDVTITAAGDYWLAYNDVLEGVVTRGNVTIDVLVNGSPVPGGRCSSHYIRNTNSHNVSSCSFGLFLPGLSPGDVLTVSAATEAAGGTITAGDDVLLSVFRK